MAEISAFAERPTITEGSLAWAGQRAVAALAAEPAAPAVAPAAGRKGKGKAKAGRGRKK